MAPKNGYVPESQLVEVEPGIQLARDTAAAYLRAKAAARADGVALSIARPAGGYRSFGTQQDMHVHPALYNLDPTSTAGLAAAGHSGHGLGNRVDINGNGRPWFLTHCAEYGFVREFGAADPGHYEFPGETWPGADGAPGSPTVVPGWHVGETDFTGKYGENELNGARWYCIEPDTNNSKTIWAVANNHGVTLAQVAGWTARVAASKWGGQLLQPGSSWWDGSGRYFAGVCIALNDVAAILDAYEAQQIADQVAANATALAVDPETTSEGAPGALTADNAITGLTPTPKPEPAKRLTTKQRVAEAAQLSGLPSGSVDAVPDAPLAGLFAGNPIGRRRAYFAYAGSALLISFGPDIVTAGVLTAHQTPIFVTWVSLATSVLLKVGVAFGFVAASNVGK